MERGYVMRLSSELAPVRPDRRVQVTQFPQHLFPVEEERVVVLSVDRLCLEKPARDRQECLGAGRLQHGCSRLPLEPVCIVRTRWQRAYCGKRRILTRVDEITAHWRLVRVALEHNTRRLAEV